MIERNFSHIYGAVRASGSDPAILQRCHAELANSCTSRSNELLRIADRRIKTITEKMIEISNDLKVILGSGEYHVR